MMLSLVWPIASLGFLLSMTQESFTAANRIAEIFDAPREIVDGPQADAPGGRQAGIGRRRLPLPRLRTTLGAAPRHRRPSNRGRRWRSSGRPDRASRCSPRCCRGSTTSPRARSASTARDIRELSLPALRQTVATAFEDPTLFSMSVAENLRLGRPDATDEQMAQAIEVAAAQFVYDLPFGLDTRIGEQGMSLSGGQRQRLSLARAILAAPRILVLDDTLSALDVHTEAVVEEALRRVLHAVTGIVVAHRASTVLLADKVALLQDGTITHVGTHAELLATVPQYRYLLAADDELDDGAERACAWQDDEDRNRLGQAHEEQEALEEGLRRTAVRATRRPRADRSYDRYRMARQARRGPDRRPADRRERAATTRGTGAAVARCCGRTAPRSPCSRSSSWWKTLPACRFRYSCSAASTTASRRSSTAGRRTRCWWSSARCARWCSSRPPAGCSSCGGPAASGRRSCWSCGGGCSGISSASTSRSTSATRRAGW